jgi:hypothetical protein
MKRNPSESYGDLQFMEEQNRSIHWCSGSLVKDNVCDMREGGVQVEQEALRAPLAIGGKEGRSQAINKKYF